MSSMGWHSPIPISDAFVNAASENFSPRSIPSACLALTGVGATYPKAMRKSLLPKCPCYGSVVFIKTRVNIRIRSESRKELPFYNTLLSSFQPKNGKSQDLCIFMTNPAMSV